MPGMSETTMPDGGGDTGEEGVRLRARHGQMQGVKRTGAIAPDDHVPGTKILHREAKRVKLNRTVIISGKLAHRNKRLNNVWSDKNIIKVKGAR